VRQDKMKTKILMKKSVRVEESLWERFALKCRKNKDRIWDILKPAIKNYMKKKPKK